MTTTSSLPNKYRGICSCGRRVDAGAGFYSYGNVYCTEPVDGTCPRWSAQQRQRQQADADVQVRMNEWKRIVAFLNVYGFALDQRARKTARVMAERQAHAEAHDGDVCTRCGGAGGHRSWPGYTCFDCGGRGWMPKMGPVDE